MNVGEELVAFLNSNGCKIDANAEGLINFYFENKLVQIKKLSPDEIVKQVVMNVSGVTIEQLLSSSTRTPPVPYCRKAITVILVDYFGYSFVAITQILNYANHTSARASYISGKDLLSLPYVTPFDRIYSESIQTLIKEGVICNDNKNKQRSEEERDTEDSN